MLEDPEDAFTSALLWKGMDPKVSDAAALDACSGRFANSLYGAMQVERTAQGLVARIGAMELRLEPAQPGVFGASDDTLEAPEPLQCDAQKGSIRWREQEFARAAADS